MALLWSRNFAAMMERVMKKPVMQTALHLTPKSRVERQGRWHPAWSVVDQRGIPLADRFTKAEIEEFAQRNNLRPIFHNDFASARAAALLLPGDD